MTINTTPLTPMMMQWKECKEEAKDALLLFRLGDFYEAFHQDALTISQELDLTLTERQGISMCGVPWHTLDGYVDRLITRGLKVAIAEQVEDPKLTKGLVKRKIVRIASPGTIIASTTVHDKKPNFIACIAYLHDQFGLSLIDLTSSSFFVFETADPRKLLSELYKEAPKEILLSRKNYERHRSLFNDLTFAINYRLQLEDEWRFDPMGSQELLKSLFGVHTLDGFGVKDMPAAIASAGALVSYLKDNFVTLAHIRSMQPISSRSSLLLDRQTLTNLEIIDSGDERRKGLTLFSLLDRCITAMGSRALREWVKNPLLNPLEIAKRQDAIDELLQNELPKAPLEHIKDLERLCIRIQTGHAGPRDFSSLQHALAYIPQLQSSIENRKCEFLKSLHEVIQPFSELRLLITSALVDNPPFRVSEGGLFKKDFNGELDELLAIRHSSHEWLLNYQEKLRQETGIKTLKVGFTRMFGYYIEVSKAQAEKMPAAFHRRQTLVNAERYLTLELKEFEDKILSADEKIMELEQKLFEELKHRVKPFLDEILKTARAIASIDVLYALAKTAQEQGYVRPVVDHSSVIDIEAGRHPIIESLVQGKHFVPNDLFLDGDSRNLMILTGPNMAGKSTYIRQIALIVILAQIGSFVPAKRARIGIVDKLFSRIGASDDLARGQSTFMVEMTETASILHQATNRSLVILDEIGRGTSTYDGISIAWAVVEYLATQENKRAKTLFATHYYELTELERNHHTVFNATVAVSEAENQIRFLHKIIRGKTDKSYGIHVAAIAGLPDIVVQRAKTLLLTLEQKEIKALEDYQCKPNASNCIDTKEQLVIQRLKTLPLDTMTPIQGLTTLFDIVKILN